MNEMNSCISTLVLIFLRWLTLISNVAADESEFEKNPNLQLIHESIQRLDSGKFLHYHVPNNIYPSRSALKIVLDSLSGDADLYVSPSAIHSKPTYLSYSLKSASYGVDVVNVPTQMKRPLAIGIYCHPNYKYSSFRIRIYIDHYNSVDEFVRIRAASCSDDKSYEELSGRSIPQTVSDKQTSGHSKPSKHEKDKGGKKTTHRVEEKSSWVTTLILHILEFLLEVFL